MNIGSLRLCNSVVITYFLVTMITLLVIATMDPKLPTAFLFALVSPKFWRLAGEGFTIFMGVAIALHFALYAVACTRKGTGGWLIQAVLAAILNGAFYFLVFFTLMLSGLRH